MKSCDMFFPIFRMYFFVFLVRFFFAAQLLCLNVQVDFEHLDVFGVEDVTDVSGGETRPQFLTCLTCFNVLVKPVMKNFEL